MRSFNFYFQVVFLSVSKSFPSKHRIAFNVVDARHTQVYVEMAVIKQYAQNDLLMHLADSFGIGRLRCA